MKTNSSHPPSAFTMVEMLSVLFVCAMLLGFFFLLPISPRTKAKAPRIKCVNNLKNVGLAYRIYATDHNGLFPWEAPTNGLLAAPKPILPNLLRYFGMVSNELSTPKIIVCPADSRKPATNFNSLNSNNQLSYFLSPDATETNPNSFLAGDRNVLLGGLRGGPGVRRIKFNTQLGWDETIHQKQGDACMGDGSVQQFSNARLREQMRNTGRDTNWITTFLIP